MLRTLQPQKLGELAGQLQKYDYDLSKTPKIVAYLKEVQRNPVEFGELLKTQVAW